MNNSFERIFIHGCSHIDRPCCESARQGNICVPTNPCETAVQLDFFWRSVIIVVDQISIFNSNTSPLHFYFHRLYPDVLDAVERKCHERITTKLILPPANDKLVW